MYDYDPVIREPQKSDANIFETDNFMWLSSQSDRFNSGPAPLELGIEDKTNTAINFKSFTSYESSQSFENEKVSFENAKKTTILPPSKNIRNNDPYCQWCCHSFDNNKYVLPLCYRKKKYETYGCFCSPSCAAAFNFSESPPDLSWDRYALLNNIYNSDTSDFDQIKVASSRESLAIFGGPLSIEEFRSNNLGSVENMVSLMPPIVHISKIHHNVNSLKLGRQEKNKVDHDTGFRLSRPNRKPSQKKYFS